MNINERIVQRMSKLGLKQKDIVKRTGLTRGAVSQWINQPVSPKGENLWKLCEVLECSPQWLLGETNVVPPPQLLGGAIDDDIFLECYKLFENSVLLSGVVYSQEVKSQCLVRMYAAALDNNSAGAAMLKYLTSLTPQQ